MLLRPAPHGAGDALLSLVTGEGGLRLPDESARRSMAPAVELPHTRQLDLRARHGETYRLFVALPPQAAPAGGFPLVFMVDGNALFPIAAATARQQSGRPDVTGVEPAILVGIGYPCDAPFDMERRARDLLPADGGADRLLDFMLGEVLPMVAASAPVDAGRLSLIGHSFGGLFALHALFTRPQAFGSLVAGSPSIWWNDRAILADEARFRSRAAAGALPRLLIALGGEEQSPARPVAPERAQRLRMARMLDNAGEMAERLAGSGRVSCELAVFPGESHISVIPAMLARAMAFVLAQASPTGAQTP